jgi:hypothetical protein
MYFYYQIVNQIATTSTHSEYKQQAQQLLISRDASIRDLKEFILSLGEKILETKQVDRVRFEFFFPSGLYDSILGLFSQVNNKDKRNLYDLCYVVDGKVKEVVKSDKDLPTILGVKSRRKLQKPYNKEGLLQPRKVVNRPKEGWIEL